MPSPLLSPDLLSDADLSAMADRAFRQAVRDWQEYRAYSLRDEAKAMLLAAAEASEAFWADLTDEQDRRLADASHQPDGPVTSPWVRLAEGDELSSMAAVPVRS